MKTRIHILGEPKEVKFRGLDLKQIKVLQGDDVFYFIAINDEVAKKYTEIDSFHYADLMLTKDDKGNIRVILI